MPNEDVILDFYAFTDEGVTGNLAAFADTGILLDFDEGPNLGFVPDFAAVQIDELGEPHVLAEPYAWCDRDKFVHRATASPRLRMDLSAASRMRTTRSPATPSLNGFVFSWMHLRK